MSRSLRDSSRSRPADRYATARTPSHLNSAAHEVSGSGSSAAGTASIGGIRGGNPALSPDPGMRPPSVPAGER